MAKQKLNNSRFARWVRAYGIARLARTLGLFDRKSVKVWIRPGSTSKPSVINAKRIVALSTADPKEIGPLNLEDML